MENERGEVEPTPFASKHVENMRGEAELTPFGSKRVENERGEVELTPLVSKRVENEGGERGWSRNWLHFETRWPDVILAKDFELN